MSAWKRIADVDALVEEALSITVSPYDDFEPGVAQLVTLLRALVEAQAATAEALVEANEHRQLAFRVEYPGEDSLRHAGTPTRPYAGD